MKRGCRLEAPSCTWIGTARPSALLLTDAEAARPPIARRRAPADRRRRAPRRRRRRRPDQGESGSAPGATARRRRLVRPGLPLRIGR
jgi:hypothetical protein